jgi:3-hydroxyacyl-CoA dehydrogenase
MAGKIAIVGAGLIGRSWAIVFARGGHEVALYDADSGQTARALENIAVSLADMEEAGLIAKAGALKARIRKAANLGEAVVGATHVQENVAEAARGSSKCLPISKLAAQDAVLASSSSALIPSLIFENWRGASAAGGASDESAASGAHRRVAALTAGDHGAARPLCRLRHGAGHGQARIDGFILNRCSMRC